MSFIFVFYKYNNILSIYIIIKILKDYYNLFLTIFWYSINILVNSNSNIKYL